MRDDSVGVVGKERQILVWQHIVYERGVDLLVIEEVMDNDAVVSRVTDVEMSSCSTGRLTRSVQQRKVRTTR